MRLPTYSMLFSSAASVAVAAAVIARYGIPQSGGWTTVMIRRSNDSPTKSVSSNGTSKCSSSISLQSPAPYLPWRNTTQISPTPAALVIFTSTHTTFVTTVVTVYAPPAESSESSTSSSSANTKTALSTRTETATVTTVVTVYDEPTADPGFSSISFSFDPTTSIPTNPPSSPPTESTAQTSVPSSTLPDLSDSIDPSSTTSSPTPSTFSSITTPIVSVSGAETLSLLSTATPAATVAEDLPPTQPTPGSLVQADVSSSCSKYAVAKLGDTCDKFISVYGLRAEDFYAWNPVLGKGGQDCSRMFWAQYAYCVGVTG